MHLNGSGSGSAKGRENGDLYLFWKHNFQLILLTFNQIFPTQTDL